jgi:hypothetical protein
MYRIMVYMYRIEDGRGEYGRGESSWADTHSVVGLKRHGQSILHLVEGYMTYGGCYLECEGGGGGFNAACVSSGEYLRGNNRRRIGV